MVAGAAKQKALIWHKITVLQLPPLPLLNYPGEGGKSGKKQIFVT